MNETAGLRRLSILFLGLVPALPAGILEVSGSATAVSPFVERFVRTLETYPNSSQRRFVDFDYAGRDDLASTSFYLDYSLPAGSSMTNPPVLSYTIMPHYLLTTDVQVTRLDPVSGFAPALAGYPDHFPDSLCTVGAEIGGKRVSAWGCFDWYLFFPPGDYPAQGRVLVGADAGEFFIPGDPYGGFNSRTVFTYESRMGFEIQATLILEYASPLLGVQQSAPEPGTMLLAGGCLMGLALLGARARRCG